MLKLFRQRPNDFEDYLGDEDFLTKDEQMSLTYNTFNALRPAPGSLDVPIDSSRVLKGNSTKKSDSKRKKNVSKQ